jgi:AmiR/NasT family two-component response regulator
VSPVEEVRRLAPDIVVRDLSSPNRNMLKQMGWISRE